MTAPTPDYRNHAQVLNIYASLLEEHAGENDDSTRIRKAADALTHAAEQVEADGPCVCTGCVKCDPNYAVPADRAELADLCAIEQRLRAIARGREYVANWGRVFDAETQQCLILFKGMGDGSKGTEAHEAAEVFAEILNYGSFGYAQALRQPDAPVAEDVEKIAQYIEAECDMPGNDGKEIAKMIRTLSQQNEQQKTHLLNYKLRHGSLSRQANPAPEYPHHTGSGEGADSVASVDGLPPPDDADIQELDPVNDPAENPGPDQPL